MENEVSVSGTGTCMRDYIQRFLNEPISVLCMRYWYRGILSEVGTDYIVLSDPWAVEQAGPAASNSAIQEDKLPTDLMIKTMAIEMVTRPNWTWKGYNVSNAPEVDE